MPKRFPLAPAHPERNCWGCDQYCAATDMRCGNGSVRTPHPIELFGEDWHGGGQDLNFEQPALRPDLPASIGRLHKAVTPG